MRSQIPTGVLRFGVVVGCLWAWSLAFGPPPAGAEVLRLAKPLQPDAAYGRLPLHFERNGGQADAAVKFLARGRGYTVLLAGSEAVLSLRPGSGEEASSRGRPDRAREVGERETPGRGGSVVLRLQLLGAYPSVPAVAEEPLPTKVNYFLGNDPAKWRTGIPTSAKVRYPGIYPGIDLVYYGTQGQLEHDFVIAPGADPAAIRLRVQGADALTIDPAGELLL
ncbi:MAG TPA: hypothetical protein VLH58_05685, partial [Candidatus Methylomirabilis sp.]|nr:hypothetical protein [Candidatus Methylomirabilis sp.]